MKTNMEKKYRYSDSPKVQILIDNILSELCPFLDEQTNEIKELTALGKALGNGDNITSLLEMILSLARRFTRADGGTLYLFNSEKKRLEFTEIQNDTLNIQKSGKTINLPCIELYGKDGSRNLSHVSTYVLHTGHIINIDDVYKAKNFNFDGTKKFDKILKYRSRSMIVIPMKNHENQIIGVLQLINSMDSERKKVVPFSRDSRDKAEALASQASVILTQQMLILELKNLFESLIQAIAVSIDAKSKHTGGHIQRVTELCLMIAEQINNDCHEFKDTRLSEDEIDELRIAALLHDTGKITTPEHIINKSSRLETVFDRFELIKTRWKLFKTDVELKAAQKKLNLMNCKRTEDKFKQIENEYLKELAQLDSEIKILETINTCKTHLNKTQISQLKEIKNKSTEINGEMIDYISSSEYEYLQVCRGNLTDEERETINNHVDLSEKILSKLPWPKKLKNIPKIAGAHHERLDGSGYPLHLKADQLNIQTRILAISDIFEALSAQDRPYKRPLKLSQSKKILKQMGKQGHLDQNIISLFFSSQIYTAYAKKHLNPEQIDL